MYELIVLYDVGNKLYNDVINKLYNITCPVINKQIYIFLFFQFIITDMSRQNACDKESSQTLFVLYASWMMSNQRRVLFYSTCLV